MRRLPSKTVRSIDIQKSHENHKTLFDLFDSGRQLSFTLLEERGVGVDPKALVKLSNLGVFYPVKKNSEVSTNDSSDIPDVSTTVAASLR